MTGLLLDAGAPAARRLCLLGAGNLNDVDIGLLLSAFDEIVAVDLDGAAVRRGLARQGFMDDRRITTAAPVDVTGVYPLLSHLVTRGIDNAGGTGPRDSADGADLVDQCLVALGGPPWTGHGSPFDVVGSVGLMTQLIDAAAGALGTAHPRLWPLVRAVRTQHLRLLLQLATGGGAAVLVTEVLSSDTCPELSSTTDADLPRLLDRQIAARNFFTGTNPVAVRRAVSADPELAGQLASCSVTPPWLWHFTARTYATYALILRTRREPDRCRAGPRHGPPRGNGGPPRNEAT
ncbi:MAG TPA: hypothetical protein VES42_14950 [Pilimelia sp.]|nr:hypothetical protein [Pilimelia sp.]